MHNNKDEISPSEYTSNFQILSLLFSAYNILILFIDHKYLEGKYTVAFRLILATVFFIPIIEFKNQIIRVAIWGCLGIVTANSFYLILKYTLEIRLFENHYPTMLFVPISSIIFLIAFFIIMYKNQTKEQPSDPVLK